MAARRNARAQLDINIAKAATPQIARAFRAEGRAIAAATAGISTAAAWERAARGAVKDSRWIATITTLWLSDPIARVWVTQQDELGTEYTIPADVRASMSRIAAEHGRAIAETNRDRLSRMIPDSAKAQDRTNPKRVFRSSMRRRLTAEYAHLAGTSAGNIAFIETLQATETIRYESARVSATRSKYRMRKVWFTQGDSRVRSSHQAVNGQSRFVDHRGWGGKPGRFRVGGAPLRFPRDPTGPVGEVIRCRCFLEYRRVRAR